MDRRRILAFAAAEKGGRGRAAMFAPALYTASVAATLRRMPGDMVYVGTADGRFVIVFDKSDGDACRTAAAIWFVARGAWPGHPIGRTRRPFLINVLLGVPEDETIDAYAAAATTAVFLDDGRIPTKGDVADAVRRACVESCRSCFPRWRAHLAEDMRSMWRGIERDAMPLPAGRKQLLSSGGQLPSWRT